MTMTAVSLFAGVGGFDLAFERAGARVVAAVEIDAPARQVLTRRFPDTTLFPDVTKVSGDDLRSTGFVPERGIITAGFPCQDLSVAGRRRGLAGQRSGLWWHVVRLLAELRPTWLVAENVPGLLSATCPCPGDGTHDNCNEPHPIPGGYCVGGCIETHGGAMGAVLGSLADLGYGYAYRVLDAKHFGVPQQRRRVFIVGHLGTPFGAAAQVLFEPNSGAGNPAAGDEAGERATAGAADSAQGSRAKRIDTHTHNDSAGRRETRLPDRRRIRSRRTPHRHEEKW